MPPLTRLLSRLGGGAPAAAEPLYGRYLEQGTARGCLVVNTFRIEGDDLIFAGNLVPPFGLPIGYRLEADGREVGFDLIRPSPDLSARFGAGTVFYYEARTRLDRRHGDVLITGHPGGVREPVAEQSWVIPLDPATLPEPARRRRVHGTEEASSYLIQGASAAWKIRQAAESYGGGLQGQVLDWGCGCGRVLQPLMRYGPGCAFSACDIDQDNLAWCAENLPGPAYAAVSHEPPLPYQAASFGLVYGISVFSHVRPDQERKWVEEIARILEPGGLALMSVKGAHGQIWEQPRGIVRHLRGGGPIDAGRDRALAGKVARPDLYRLAFHTPQHLWRVWSPRFELLAVVPGAIGGTQDLVVARRRAE